MRSTGDLSVRVPVCHWLELPRPVSSNSGYLSSTLSGCFLGSSNSSSSLAIGVIELAVFKQPALLTSLRRLPRGQGPLDAAHLVDAAVVLDAGDVARPPGAEALEDLKRGLR